MTISMFQFSDNYFRVYLNWCPFTIENHYFLDSLHEPFNWPTAKKGVHQFSFFLSSMRTPDYLTNQYKCHLYWQQSGDFVCVTLAYLYKHIKYTNKPNNPSIDFVQLLGVLQNDMNTHVFITNTGTQCVHQTDPMRTPVNVIL